MRCTVNPAQLFIRLTRTVKEDIVIIVIPQLLLQPVQVLYQVPGYNTLQVFSSQVVAVEVEILHKGHFYNIVQLLGILPDILPGEHTLLVPY
jgi:hypothetical protein